MQKEYTCIMCPKGCSLVLETTDLSVTGNSCPKGAEYAVSEYTHPKRVVTSTVRTNSKEIGRVPVKTSEPILVELIDGLLDTLYQMQLDCPIKCGDVIISNYQNTNVDVIATRTILK